VALPGKLAGDGSLVHVLAARHRRRPDGGDAIMAMFARWKSCRRNFSPCWVHYLDAERDPTARCRLAVCSQGRQTSQQRGPIK